MAIWQVHFQLIPMDQTHLHKNILLDENSIAILSTKLPCNQSWCEEDKLFGDLDTTCVEICFFDSEIDEISVRLDVANLSINQVNSIIKFATTNNLQISYNERTMLASIENICNIVRESDAFRFLHDPEQFLSSIAQNEKHRDKV